MLNVKDLLEILSAIPEDQREHIYVYATTKDIPLTTVKDAEYDEHATCSGGLIVKI